MNLMNRKKLVEVAIPLDVINKATEMVTSIWNIRTTVSGAHMRFPPGSRDI